MKEKNKNWPESGGEMAHQIRERNWEQTPLGPMHEWPGTLRDSLQILLDAPLPMMVCWGDTLLTFYNDAYQPLLTGMPDCQGKPFLDIWPENADMIQSHLDKALNGESSFIENFSFSSHQSNGHDKSWFDYHVNPLRNEDGEISGIVHILLKKDGRSETANKSAKSNRSLELVLHAARMGTWEVTVGSGKTKTDRRHDAIFGYPEGVSDWGLELLHEHILPGERSRLDQALDNVFDDGVFDLEAPVRWPDGSVHWVHDRGYVDFDENGWPRKIAGITVDITDQKETEKALRDAEKHLRLATQAANMHVCEVDLQNETFIWPGKVPHEVNFPMPKTFEDAEALLHPDDKAAVMSTLAGITEHEGNFEMEYRVIDPESEEVIWVYSAGTAILNDNGEYTRIVSVTKNITNRKREEIREQFLSDLSRKLQLIGDPEKIMQTTARMLGEFLEVDRCTYAEAGEDEDHFKVLGSYRREGVPGMNAHVSMSSFGQEALNHMHQNKVFVVNNAKADNRIAPNDLNAYEQNNIMALICAPLIKDDKFIAKVAVHQQNPRTWTTEEIELIETIANRFWETLQRVRVTRKLKRMNETLEERVAQRTKEVLEQEERFRKLVEASSQMVWTTDAEGIVRKDSPSWREFTGQSYDEWKGSGWLDVVHPEDRELAITSWRHAVKTKTIHRTEFRIYHNESDSYHWTKVRGVPLYDNDGEVRGWVGMSTDINEQKQVEETRRIYQHNLQSLASELSKAEEKERQRLAEELHNNLGQMLAISKMRLDTLAKEDAVNNESELVDQIRNLTNEALTYTRELMSDLKPPPSIDKEELTEVLVWVAQKMKKHGLSVSVENQHTPARVNEEIRTTIRRCVNELLFNVVKHAETDEANVIVSRENGQIKVDVKDGGKGFDIEKTKLIPDNEGGFGLFNIRERMAWLGGRLEIWSRPGEGTRATLYAPAEADKKEVDQKEGLTEPYSGNHLDFSSKETVHIKVLLVDDHEMMRMGLRKLIEEEDDMSILAEASSGEEAIQMAREMKPDVIVMDVNLPDMSGIEATQKITNNFPKICIIGLSLYDQQEVARDMQSAGAVAYLTKTDAFQSLSSTIRENVSTDTSK